jgi:hypothetical protein
VRVASGECSWDGGGGCNHVRPKVRKGLEVDETDAYCMLGSNNLPEGVALRFESANFSGQFRNLVVKM